MLFLHQLRAQMLSFAPSSPPELTKIQRQRRSYGNIVSLPSLKTKILCQTRFSATVAIVATGADYMETRLKPGFHIIAPVATIATVVVKRVSADGSDIWKHTIQR